MKASGKLIRRHSPIKRIGRNRVWCAMSLNAIGNSGDAIRLCAPCAEALTADPDPVVADAAGWALSRHRGARMLKKRSFSLAGHRTSVALEVEFWQALACIDAGAMNEGRSAGCPGGRAGRRARPVPTAWHPGCAFVALCEVN